MNELDLKSKGAKELQRARNMNKDWSSTLWLDDVRSRMTLGVWQIGLGFHRNTSVVHHFIRETSIDLIVKAGIILLLLYRAGGKRGWSDEKPFGVEKRRRELPHSLPRKTRIPVEVCLLFFGVWYWVHGLFCAWWCQGCCWGLLRSSTSFPQW